MTAEELKAQIDTINAEIAQNLLKRDEQIKANGTANQETKSALENLAQQVARIQADLLRPHSSAPVADSMKSVGQKAIESEAFKSFRDRAWHKGGASFSIDGQAILERKTTITSATVGSSTPGILVPQRIPGIVKPPQEQVRVRDLIPFGTTTNNAVEFVKELVFTNAASPQVEGSDKAESALTFEIAYANVRTIAHFIPATRQILDDFQQLQQYIDVRLMDGLADEEDSQLLSGDGVGQSLHGLTHEATGYVGTYDAASDTRLDKLNHAIAELEAAKYRPDGWILNPVDLRIIQVIKTNEGGANLGPYILGGPGTGMPATIWGLPVAVTTAMPVGYFLCGAFRAYCMGFDRMQARIDISTEHEDYFVKNMVAIRAEERITLAVFKGAAFRYGAF